jgi:hypothetical protein
VVSVFTHAGNDLNSNCQSPIRHDLAARELRNVEAQPQSMSHVSRAASFMEHPRERRSQGEASAVARL